MRLLGLILVLGYFSVPVYSAPSPMRVSEMERRHVYENYSSPTLKTVYTVTVYLPENYSKNSNLYPSLYWCEDETSPNKGDIPDILTSAESNAKLSDKFAGMIIISINGLNPSDFKNAKKAMDFIARDLVPFIDVNYRTKKDPLHRIIAAKNIFPVYLTVNRPGSFKNAAVFLSERMEVQYMMALKKISFPLDSKFWIDFKFASEFKWSDFTGIYFLFREHALKCLDNFVLLRHQDGNPKINKTVLMLDYFAGDGKGFGVKSAKAFVTSKKIRLFDVAKDSGVPTVAFFGAKLRLKNKLNPYFFPKTAKTSLPYLSYIRGTVFANRDAKSKSVKISSSFRKKRFSKKIRVLGKPKIN